MRLSVKILAAIGVVAVVLMVGVMQGWFGSKPSNHSRVAPGPQTGAAGSNAVVTVPRLTSTVVKTSAPSSVPTSRPPEVVRNVPPANANLITNWEERLDAVLGSEGEEADKAKQLLAIFSRLPEDGQVEVVQHLSNLVADQDYAPLGKLLTDATLPEDVLEQLMADILNRPNSLKLPVLLEVARNPQHPKAEDAKDLLELYLEEDYGQDWTKWQAKVQEWVQQNPD